MKKAIFIFITIMLVSCTTTSERDSENDASGNSTEIQQEILDEELNAVQLRYYDTIMVHGTEMMIIPIGANEKNNKRSSRSKFNLSNDNFKFGGDGYWEKDYRFTFFNLIFYDLEKDSSYLFFENERALIHQVIPNINKEGEDASRFIFYRIQNRDYNLDGKISSKDGEYLFISDKKGKNLIQLTPNNTKLRSWTIIKKSNIILAEVLVDINDDKKFIEKDDEVRLLKIDLEKLKKGKPLLDDSLEKQLKEQFIDLYSKEDN